MASSLVFGQVPVQSKISLQQADAVSTTNERPIESGVRATYWSDSFGSGGPTTTDLPTGWSNTVTGGPVGFPGWEFTMVGHTGAYPTSAITSATAGDGWLIVDSDLHGTSGGGTPENCDLLSPWINVGTTGPQYMLQFDQVFREYVLDETTVSVTKMVDGTPTTTDFLINEGVGNVNPTPTTTMGIIIASAISGGEDSVQVNFNWYGDWDYGWQIDDVAIVDAPNDDIRMAAQYYNTATPNTTMNNFWGEDVYFTHRQIPATHIDDVSFYATSYNFGSDAQTGVTAFAEYGGSVFASSTPIVQASNATDTVYVGDFNLPATAGQYDFTVALTYDDSINEVSPADMTRYDSVWVTDGIFGIDRQQYIGFGYYVDWASGGEAGAIYEARMNDVAYAVEVVLMSNQADGTIIFPMIYKYDTGADDYVLEYDGQFVAEYVVDAANDLPTPGPYPTSIVLPLDAPLNITSGDVYYVAVGCYGGDTLRIATSGTCGYGSGMLQEYGGTPPWWTITSAPIVRLWVNGSPIGIDEEDNSLTLGQNIPNPTNGFTTINYSLVSSVEASFQIVDITGKVVYDETLGNVSAGNHNITLDVSEFAQGVYYYTLTAGEQASTRKMVITE